MRKPVECNYESLVGFIERTGIWKDRPYVLIGVALVALVLGALIYMVDRPTGSARLIPYYLQFAKSGSVSFGWLGAYLPSFFHIYAFILLTMAALRPSFKTLFITCALWLCIDGIFELLQHPSIYERLSTSGIPMALIGGGVFDPLDIAALVIGMFAAFLTVVYVIGRADR